MDYNLTELESGKKDAQTQKNSPKISSEKHEKQLVVFGSYNSIQRQMITS